MVGRLGFSPLKEVFYGFEPRVSSVLVKVIPRIPVDVSLGSWTKLDDRPTFESHSVRDKFI